MNHHLSSVLAPVAVIGLVTLAGCASIPGISGLFRAPSVTGDWLVPAKDSVVDLTLLEEGDKITGRYGVSIIQFAIKGKRSGNDVSLAYAINMFGSSSSVTIAGRVSDDGKKITGIATTVTDATESEYVEVEGGTSTESFVANRKP